MPTTLADIADRAGVSAAAVSLALNGKKGVSDETRARVLAIAREQGYRINRLGRALRQSRAGAVGLYLPESAVHFGYYTEATLGLTERLHAADLSLLIVPSTPTSARIESYPPVDGFILIEPHSDDAGAAHILGQGLPVVTGDAPPAGFPSPWGTVESPNTRTTRQVLDRFTERGAQRPGLFLVERVSAWAQELESAYREWCAERRLEPRVLLESIHTPNDVLAGRLRDWADPESGVDAVFVGADGVAVRLAGLLRTLGRRPGADIAIVSGVDSLIMEFHTPPITAVDLQPREFGRACGELLLELLDEPRPAETVRRTLDAVLRVRESG
ncbi:LacI family DNA-binding transcriptional regulator [Leifsonia sp. F6_8S_P_1B]|uniref:LacI family DNA-binding transcriptional regulator n=1 Tax=Leifsonia williamsii TaxID=3035919 RepID=A0ABT8KGB7_9MICO|nr:LacI family DNA-binding transcriptional regulator [Leifsonia williamsii]MDN4616033.1 LacI family DNA-binding transcriptional regulator [Leifsonia williamsii]